jgi:uncharacterized protein YecE (DUF72 family)
MQLRIPLGFAALVAILIAGCGGGDSSSGSGSTSETGSTTAAKDSKPLSRTELNTRMNEICVQVPPTYAETLKELEKGGKKLSKAESNLKAALPQITVAFESMEELTPSPAEEQDLEETIAALKVAAKGLEKEPNSKLSGPGSPFAEFQEKAKEFEYQSCEGL